MASPRRSLPVRKPPVPVFPQLISPSSRWPGRERLFRAHGQTAAAAVTHFGKGQEQLTHDTNGLKLAKIGAGAAERAFRLIHHRHRQLGRGTPCDGWVEKEMQVGLLHIQVHGQHRPIPNSSQGGGYRGLARAALAARHRNDHRPASRLAA